MAKKILLLIALILFSLLGKNYLRSTTNTGNPQAIPTQAKGILSYYLSPTTVPYVKKVPVRLVVSQIGVDANIESLGMDSSGRMDIPKVDTDVGWWQPGVSPGESGNAVIDGHYDKHDGSPSVFYKLKELKKGSVIKVYFGDGTDREFEVYDTELFKDASFPINEVFGFSGDANLNLITCGGVFDRNQRNYSDRVVVFSKLKN